MRASLAMCLGLALVVLPSSVMAAPILIDFENLSDGDALTNQIAGFNFVNAVTLTAGISLNEFEFPPLSGTNVIFDMGGPMRIDFSAGVTSVSAYITYLAPIVMTAFDSGGTILGTTHSQFGNNLALSGQLGSTPNELIALAFDDIAYVTIAGDSAGGSFTLDNLTADTVDSVPEPGVLSLAVTGGCLALASGRRRRTSRARSRG